MTILVHAQDGSISSVPISFLTAASRADDHPVSTAVS